MFARPVVLISCLMTVALGFAPSAARGQAASVDVMLAEHNDVPLITPVYGLNFVLNETGQHDSSTGWADVINPTLIYRFNRHLFVSASSPVYPFIYAYLQKKNGTTTTSSLEEGHFLLADTMASGDLSFERGNSNEELIATIGLPTGNVRYGLSADQETYNVTNHFDYQVGWFDPEIEIGEGDSSNLVSRAVKKPYVAVGALANFEVGTGIDLPRNINLELDAYEDLPIGNQNVYGTVTHKNKAGKTVTRQVLQGTGAAEDNGFTAELDIPLHEHLQLIGTYQRSLVQGLDTASVGITWTLRRPRLHVASN